MKTLATLLTTPRLLARLGVSLAVVAVYIAAIYVPGPALTQAGAQCTATLGGVYGVLAVLGGGAITRLSPVSLGIAPVITAALVATLVMRVVPAWKSKQGKPARRIIARIAVIGGAVIVVGNAANIATGAQNGTLISGCPDPMIGPGWGPLLLTAATIIAGTAALVALAEVATRHGIGNGFTLLIATGILVGVPGELSRVGTLEDWRYAVVAGVILIVLVAALMWVSAKKVGLGVSRDGDGGEEQSWQVPFNPAGLMPLVMASILMYLPSLTMSLFGAGSGVYEWVNTWFANGTSWVFLGCLMLLTVAFTFYQVIASYDAQATARTFAEVDAYVTGTHTEEDSARAIDSFLLKVTTRAAAVLAVLAILPAVAAALLGVNSALPLGGTSLLIVALAAVSISQHAAALARAQRGTPGPEDARILENPSLLG